MTLVLLCSGGIDSIVLAYALAKDHIVQPLYVQFRVGGGKASKEIKILEKLNHPNILKPIILKGKEFRISKESYDTRNQQLIKIADEWIYRKSFMNENFDAIAIGTWEHVSHGNIVDEENKPKHLQKQTNLKLYTLDDFDCKNKLDVINLGYEVVGKKLFKTTSCQLWYSYECGRCFSCLERYIGFMLSKYKKDKTIYKRKPQESKRYETFKNECI